MSRRENTREQQRDKHAQEQGQMRTRTETGARERGQTRTRTGIGVQEREQPRVRVKETHARVGTGGRENGTKAGAHESGQAQELVRMKKYDHLDSGTSRKTYARRAWIEAKHCIVGRTRG